MSESFWHFAEQYLDQWSRLDEYVGKRFSYFTVELIKLDNAGVENMGGGAGTKFTEYIRVIARGWWVPFTVMELVPRVLILQIIGQ